MLGSTVSSNVIWVICAEDNQKLFLNRFKKENTTDVMKALLKKNNFLATFSVCYDTVSSNTVLQYNRGLPNFKKVFV